MWSNAEVNVRPRAFRTPPATWGSTHSPGHQMPMSERKRVTPGCKRDLFHVIHKVPAGDSPYVRAKRVQLIEKDPSKAISLFWAAINVGDRVDSALKDMAVVMKQLNRTDEAIEAIKSFRKLCPPDSQESIDNVLIELYKRSGRIEEEIHMLQHKLKNIEEGIAFGGKRTKVARSNGKKTQITVEQERARILGNLAWAYLQCHNYGLAEQHYRKSLVLEPDNNRQCNLAICLMHMNRIPEAKSLLQAVRASCERGQMDDCYAKSYERASQTLSEFESIMALKSTDQNEDTQQFLPLPITIQLKEDPSFKNEGQHYDFKFRSSQDLLSGRYEEKESNFFESNNKSSKYVPPGLRCSQSSLHSTDDNNWRKGSCSLTSCELPHYASSIKTEILTSSIGKTLGSANNKGLNSPAPVLYTQPRRWEDMNNVGWGAAERSVRWGENVLTHTIKDLNGELLDPTDEKSEVSPADGNWTRGSRRVVAGLENRRTRTSWGYDNIHGKNAEMIGPTNCHRNARENDGQRKPAMFTQEQDISVDNAGVLEASSEGPSDRSSGATVARNMESAGAVWDNSNLSKPSRKSWADIAEEEEEVEEEELLSRESVFDGQFCGVENLNSNIIPENTHPMTQIETLSQKMGAFDFKGEYGASRNTVSSSNNPTARRSLSFETSDGVDSKRKKNRLPVFRDITPTPDSPSA